MKVNKIKVGTEFTFLGNHCRCTDVEDDHCGVVIRYDIISDDLFQDVIGWSFCKFWPCELDKEIELFKTENINKEVYEDNN